MPTLEEIRAVLEPFAYYYEGGELSPAAKHYRAAASIYARLPEQGQIAAKPSLAEISHETVAEDIRRFRRAAAPQPGRIPAPESSASWADTILDAQESKDDAASTALERRLDAETDAAMARAMSHASEATAPPTPDEAMEQEAFERWQRGRAVTMLERNPKGTWGDQEGSNYVAPFVQASWEAWRARAALQASGQEIERLRNEASGEHNAFVQWRQIAKDRMEQLRAAEAERDALREALQLVTSHDPDWLVSVVKQQAEGETR